MWPTGRIYAVTQFILVTHYLIFGEFSHISITSCSYILRNIKGTKINWLTMTTTIMT